MNLSGIISQELIIPHDQTLPALLCPENPHRLSLLRPTRLLFVQIHPSLLAPNPQASQRRANFPLFRWSRDHLLQPSSEAGGRDCVAG